MRSSVWTVLRLNKALFGWPISFLFIPVALMCKEYRRAIFVLLVGISLIGLLYFFWPYYGFEYEARYYSSSAPFLILLTAVGIIAVRGLIMKHGAADSTRRMQANSAIVVLLCCFVVYSLAYYWPIYLYPRYGDAYEGVTTRIDELAEKHHVEDAVILIRCPPHDDFLYSSGFIYNDPLLEASRIYARDLSDDNTCLCEHFPERKIILYNQENEGSPFTRVYPSRVGGENESLKLFKGGH
jgi:hypothetical protein